MSMRTVLIGMGLVGLGVAVCGCQQPLCPQGEELAKAGQTRQAVDAYLQCRSTETNAKRLEELDRRIEALTPQIVEPMVKKWDGQPLQTVGQYDQAITELEDIRRYDEPKKRWRVAEKLETYKRQRQEFEDARQATIAKAQESAEKRQWPEAIGLIEEAINKHPEDARAKGLRRTMLSQRDDSYRHQIETFCKEDRWAQANDVLMRFAKEAPEQRDDLLKELTRLVGETRTRVTRRLESDRDQKMYYRVYTSLQAMKPDRDDRLWQTILTEGWKHYLERAQTMEGDGDVYGAYLAAAKALKLSGLDPRDPKPDLTRARGLNNEVFEKYRDLARRVDDSIREEICIAAFDAPSAEAATGKEFADRLATDFYQKLPYGLHLDDRRRVDYARAQPGSNMRDALQLVGVSWLVQGNISTTFVKDRNERDKTVWVPIKKRITNPYYDSQMETLRKQYGKNEAKWPRDKLPSNTITEEMPQTVTYKVGTEQMEGQVTVSVSIYSNTEGAIVDSSSFRVPQELSVLTNDFCFSDDIKIPADPNVKIDPPKPLKMISQLEFKEKLEKEVRAQVVNWLLKSFADREKRFLQEAENYYRQLERRQAVEAAAKGYLYCLNCLKAEPPLAIDESVFARLEQLALLDLTEQPQDTSATP